MIPIVDYKLISDIPGIVVRRKDNKTSLRPYNNTRRSDDRLVIEEDSNVHSGIYVNFQEYFDTYYKNLFDKIPNIQQLTLVDREGNPKNYNNMLENVFKKLKNGYAFTLGNEYKGKNIQRYKDIENIIPSRSIVIKDIKLKRGLYVEMYMLMKLLDNYKFKETLYDNSNSSNIKAPKQAE